MEYIKEININEAIIHILDSNANSPILNEYKLGLDDENYKFILKHVEKCLKDQQLRYAKFNNERNIVKEISQEYLNGQNDLLTISKELAKQLFTLMKSNDNIESCDLMIVSISTEYGPMLGILKMDYIKNYIHVIDTVENKIGINIAPEFTGLPMTASKIKKCAFIKPIREDQEFNLMLIDKQKKSKDSEEYGSNYFIKNYLGCDVIENERDMTRQLVENTDKFIKDNIDDVKTAVKTKDLLREKLKKEDTINIEDITDEIFKDETLKQEFINFNYENNIDKPLEVDKEFVTKIVNTLKFKLNKNITLSIPEDIYSDINSFEVRDNGDGTANFIIKDVCTIR
ncbi:nucleoid-associated protein [Clostridium botulinum]|uniref:nucleoid-associated protein n=2 Tax=Clostridium botulinum TaxID=1491 RepID=UPI00099B47B2|nr:nucleoid-associated protein [Clostridium botulinum]NCI20761.1 nucleoid-associated protein [Clostridium botulinum]NCI35175.1 nucleoid-associated protein [Clostridium botulinum]NCI74254.1 nucleoid-associated protein [Clostridium botulinum]NDI38346.1 nucleoid-associated protein [Clostridium botulinum]NFR59061.1 nucleoid-associated protein [Clostridium botulinum]